MASSTGLISRLITPGPRKPALLDRRCNHPATPTQFACSWGPADASPVIRRTVVDRHPIITGTGYDNLVNALQKSAASKSISQDSQTVITQSVRSPPRTGPTSRRNFPTSTLWPTAPRADWIRWILRSCFRLTDNPQLQTLCPRHHA